MKGKKELRIRRMVGLYLRPRYRCEANMQLWLQNNVEYGLLTNTQNQNRSEESSPRSSRRMRENRVCQITHRTDKMQDLVHQIESEINGQPNEFEIGDHVRYYSVSANRWIKATVLNDRGQFADPHGRFQLSCKNCADPVNMRLLAKAAEKCEKPNKYGWQPPRRPFLTDSQANPGIVSHHCHKG